jgi:hypothetical protein
MSRLSARWVMQKVLSASHKLILFPPQVCNILSLNIVRMSFFVKDGWCQFLCLFEVTSKMMIQYQVVFRREVITIFLGSIACLYVLNHCVPCVQCSLPHYVWCYYLCMTYLLFLFMLIWILCPYLIVLVTLSLKSTLSSFRDPVYH